jgi:hypothetical protein
MAFAPKNAVPKNVAAAIGLVPTVLGGVRRRPAKAVQLPVMAVGSALAGVDAARREYDDLADRGEKLIARLRGTSLDSVEEVGKTAARAVSNINGASTANAKQAVQADAVKAKEREAANKAVQQTLEGTETPAVKPTAPVRHDSAATPDVIEQVEKIAGNVAAPLITDPSELPLADYDHLTLGSLRSRLRSLDMQQLVQLRDYEKSKADRLPVVTMLDNRIAKLANGESAPTGTAVAEPSAKASTSNKPPKTVGDTAAAKASNSPPHTKVRIT